MATKVMEKTEKMVMSSAQFNALLRLECYYRVAIKWQEIKDAANGYQAASNKIQAVLKAKEDGKLIRRAKPANFYEKRREALTVLQAQDDLPF